MTLTRGLVRNAVTTPLDMRLADMALIACNADGSPRVGVLGGANTSIVSTTGTLNLAVAAAEYVASKGKADGVTIFTNDGTVNVPVTAAPGSNSRIDVLWVRHQDSTTGDGASTPIFGVTAGTAAASPTKPAIPTGALELATLRIYAGTVATNGGANTLTNTYQMTAPRGATVIVRTAAEMTAWNAPVGSKVYVLDTGRDWVREGPVGSEVWRPVGMPGVLTASAATSLTSGTDTKVLFDDPLDLPPGMTWVGGTTRELTVNRAGRYRVTATGRFQSNSAGGFRVITLRQNGVIVTQFTVPPASGTETAGDAVAIMNLVAGDKVTVVCVQNSGATLAFNGAQLTIESF